MSSRASGLEISTVPDDPNGRQAWECKSGRAETWVPSICRMVDRWSPKKSEVESRYYCKSIPVRKKEKAGRVICRLR